MRDGQVELERESDDARTVCNQRVPSTSADVEHAETGDENKCLNEHEAAASDGGHSSVSSD